MIGGALAFLPRGPVLFRENRSFTIGGVARASDPAPSVFYGAIRTRYLVENKIDFARFVRADPSDTEVLGRVKREIGSPTDAGVLRVKGPFPCFDGRWFFPPPENAFTQGYVSKPQQGTTGELSDLDCDGLRALRLPADPSIEQRRVRGEWMPLATLKTYLMDSAADDPAVGAYLASEGRTDWQPVAELFVREDRYGHQRDPQSFVPKEEHLFSLEMIRGRDEVRAGKLTQAYWGVIVEGIDASVIARGSAWVGGRSRRCDLALIDPPDFLDVTRLLATVLASRDRCFLYLATPAIFERGWLPREIRGLRLIAAAVGRAGVLGGWDLARRQARRTVRTAPAGSVYFYEGVPSEGWAEFLATRQFASISDERQESGFGIALVGAW